MCEQRDFPSAPVSEKGQLAPSAALPAPAQLAYAEPPNRILIGDQWWLELPLSGHSLLAAPGRLHLQLRTNRDAAQGGGVMKPPAGEGADLSFTPVACVISKHDGVEAEFGHDVISRRRSCSIASLARRTAPRRQVRLSRVFPLVARRRSDIGCGDRTAALTCPKAVGLKSALGLGDRAWRRR